MKNNFKVIVVLIVIGFIILIVVLRNSYSQRSERLLSQFADPKEHYAMLLNGNVNYNGDTVSFDLLSAVQFPLTRQNKDVIVVKKANGEKFKFTRRMTNFWHIPNPSGNGKAMESWISKADYYPDPEKKLLAKEKEFFEVFERVVENGQIAYWWFGTEERLRENFIHTYRKDTAEAIRLAKKVMDPLFSSKNMGESSPNVVSSRN